MSEIASSPPAEKRPGAKDGLNFDLESMQIEIETLKKEVARLQGENSETEALKKEVAQLKGKNSELEKKLEEKKVAWRLCSKHDRNGKAIGCSTDEDRKICPFYFETTIEDVIEKIPDVAETIFHYLDLKSAMKCRRVNKSWRSFVDHIYRSNLHVAVGTGDTACVKAEGANVNIKLKVVRGYAYQILSENNYETPLHLAATSSLPHHVKIGKILIESGANLEVRDHSDVTPLLVAAKKGGQHSGDFLKLLIDAGADIEGSAAKRMDKYDIKTPLLAAVESIGMKTFAIDNIKILLEAGASLLPGEDYFYTTPISWVLVSLIRLAVSNGTEAMNDNLKVIDMFLAAGAQKWGRDGDFFTPLKFALHESRNLTNKFNRRDAAVKKLIEYYNSLPGGPDPESDDSSENGDFL